MGIDIRGGSLFNVHYPQDKIVNWTTYMYRNDHMDRCDITISINCQSSIVKHIYTVMTIRTGVTLPLASIVKVQLSKFHWTLQADLYLL